MCECKGNNCNVRKQIAQESAKSYGMECDKELWIKLLDRIEEVI